MHRLFILVFLNTLYGLIAQTCKYQISGEVIDGESNEKLSNAIVLLKTVNKVTETDSTGSYNFQNLCTDSVEIEVSSFGYKTYSNKIKLKASYHLDIILHADACELASVEIVHRKEDFKTLNTAVLTEKDLDKLRGKSLGEMLKTLPGIDATQTGPNIFKPVIQGFTGNRIVIIQNQVRLEGQNWGNDHAPETDPFTSGRITVVKGPNALMYGPEAQSGAVVLAPYTIPKRHGLFGTVYSNFQSNNRMLQDAASLDLSSHKLHGWHLHMQGSHKYGGSIRTATHYLDNTASRELNGNIGIGFESPRHIVKLYYSSFHQQLGIY
ncbi:MAG TPA: TonB-dependent receptor, partial [Cytophagales bacterium]|nr:TonB-dependent receptor [Cytophagales bacterium]